MKSANKLEEENLETLILNSELVTKLQKKIQRKISLKKEYEILDKDINDLQKQIESDLEARMSLKLLGNKTERTKNKTEIISEPMINNLTSNSNVPASRKRQFKIRQSLDTDVN